MPEPIFQTLSLTLFDAHPSRDTSLPIRLAGSASGVTLAAEGCGDHTSEPGHGSPAFLELYDGELRLVVWADIDSEEPTHIISLGGAREARRRPGGTG